MSLTSAAPTDERQQSRAVCKAHIRLLFWPALQRPAALQLHLLVHSCLHVHIITQWHRRREKLEGPSQLKIWKMVELEMTHSFGGMHFGSSSCYWYMSMYKERNLDPFYSFCMDPVREIKLASSEWTVWHLISSLSYQWESPHPSTPTSFCLPFILSRCF